MQGIRFRKYIRNDYFDIALFAADLAYSIKADSCVSMTPQLIEECFETAQVLGWAEDGVRYDMNTLDGCFGLYSHAMGLIGSKVYTADERFPSQFFQDDIWIDENWPTVEPVISHLNSQIVEGLTHSETLDPPPPGVGHDKDWERVQSFIDQALDNEYRATGNCAPVFRIH